MFGDAGFCGGRKTGEPEKNPWNKARTNKKLNPYVTGTKSNPGHIGGRRTLSALRHPRSPHQILTKSALSGREFLVWSKEEARSL